MANIKSAKKRILISESHRQRNAAAKSKMKTQLKGFSLAVESGDKENAQKELLKSVSILDKTSAKGIIHKNMAARKKSSLYRAYTNM